MSENIRANLQDSVSVSEAPIVTVVEQRTKISPELKEQISITDREIEKQREEIDKLTDDLAVAKKEFSDTKKDSITILALFATFLTYTSVEFQILKGVNSFWQVMFLSTFLVLLVVIFALVINSFSKQNFGLKDIGTGVWVLIVLLCVFLLIFLCLYTKNPSVLVS